MVRIERDPDNTPFIAGRETGDDVAGHGLLRQHPVPIAQIREQTQHVEDGHRDGDRAIGAAVAVVIAVEHPRDGVHAREVLRRRPDGQDRLAVGVTRVSLRPGEAAAARRRRTR